MSAPSPRSFLVTETIDLLLYISKTQSFTETSGQTDTRRKDAS